MEEFEGELVLALKITLLLLVGNYLAILYTSKNSYTKYRTMAIIFFLSLYPEGLVGIFIIMYGIDVNNYLFLFIFLIILTFDIAFITASFFLTRLFSSILQYVNDQYHYNKLTLPLR